jgi:hypothetical protein
MLIKTEGKSVLEGRRSHIYGRICANISGNTRGYIEICRAADAAVTNTLKRTYWESSAGT